MLKNDILTSEEELGIVAKEVFYQTKDDECYKPVVVKVNEELKDFLEEIEMRDGIDKQFIIPDSATLNNLLVVRVEDIQAKSDYYECELLVQLFAEKRDFKDLMDLEEEIKPQGEGLSDLEKIEFLNTYITENIAYDKEQRSRSALAAAITHKGTCVAFSQLFLILGEAIGLKVGCINSKEMKHRWNYAIIGDETYHIDTTFNASNPISNKLFFQTSPIHLEKAPDQGIAVPHVK
ncbi:MAG: transglutaminase domain-containing protein [Peptoniphilus harei]|nr:transglutaminase domain-containing protein [Peptoniphilus harei]